ncbi:hypothetical protein QYF36_003398 [Acer negundo]|nr:hypothetical protein QYF36_003398 [Acer negundo]
MDLHLKIDLDLGRPRDESSLPAMEPQRCVSIIRDVSELQRGSPSSPGVGLQACVGNALVGTLALPAIWALLPFGDSQLRD